MYWLCQGEPTAARVEKQHSPVSELQFALKNGKNGTESYQIDIISAHYVHFSRFPIVKVPKQRSFSQLLDGFKTSGVVILHSKMVRAAS